MTRKEALKAIEYAKERAEVIREQGQSEYWAQEINWTIEAIDMAIEALEREDHDGCDGCMYEHYEELTEPCYSCKHNYTDRYMPEPKHDRDWIVGCIKHDGFIKTDRGDKANQIILEALKTDRPRGEWIDIGGVIRWGCSLCHYAYDQKFNFCPNCGSDNRERSEE